MLPVREVAGLEELLAIGRRYDCARGEEVNGRAAVDDVGGVHGERPRHLERAEHRYPRP